MSFSKIAAAFGRVVRRGSAALLAFPFAGIVAPSHRTVQLVADTYFENR